jgi:hypothetical protein
MQTGSQPGWQGLAGRDCILERCVLRSLPHALQEQVPAHLPGYRIRPKIWPSGEIPRPKYRPGYVAFCSTSW